MTQPSHPPPRGTSDPGGTAPAAVPAHHFLEQAPVPAMDVDGFRVTVLGLVAFAVATVVTAVLYADLHRDGHGWWLGVCVSGFALGLVGLGYCFYRRGRRRSGAWDRD